MTHNTREIEEINNYLDDTVHKTCQYYVYSDLKDLVANIEVAHHHQLQKAREEERGKAIELMKIQIATGVAPSCEFILKSIISSLDHSELDQSKPTGENGYAPNAVDIKGAAGSIELEQDKSVNIGGLKWD